MTKLYTLYSFNNNEPSTCQDLRNMSTSSKSLIASTAEQESAGLFLGSLILEN